MAAEEGNALNHLNTSISAFNVTSYIRLRPATYDTANGRHQPEPELKWCHETGSENNFERKASVVVLSGYPTFQPCTTQT